jgi:adenylylsulfate kinase
LSTFAAVFSTLSSKNIYTVFNEILQRSETEKLLGQMSVVIWMRGLSGSGKTTVAKGLEQKLHEDGRLTQILDGDNIRHGINKDLGFSVEDRTENIRRIAEISKLFLDCGIITINCFVSPTNEIRARAKAIIGEDLLEVFISTPLEECERRDTKGLYAKARSGEIKDMTGISSPFEAPIDPAISIDTTNRNVEDCVNELYDFITTKIK